MWPCLFLSNERLENIYNSQQMSSPTPVLSAERAQGYEETDDFILFGLSPAAVAH